MASNKPIDRYGICLSESCAKAKAKEVQKIPSRKKDFVCEECGKPLRECPPPKKKGGSAKYIVGGCVALAALAAGGIMLMGKGGEEKVAPQEENLVETVKVETDTAIVEKPQEPEQKPQEVEQEKPAEPEKVTPKPEKPASKPKAESSGRGTLNLGYATYTGETKNGKPNGNGRMVYKSEHLISPYDTKKRTAKAGESVSGYFVNGVISIGKHYDANGALIQTLNLGAAE